MILASNPRSASLRPHPILLSSLLACGLIAASLPHARAEVIADSVADWSAAGIQGAGGWSYGYRDYTADGGGDGSYDPSLGFILFPRNEAEGNSISVTNYWNGTAYDWPNGNPPWTLLGR
ncbi:hypothetical protein BH23VER1_BH23VER1_21680 [soil metagenome]